MKKEHYFRPLRAVASPEQRKMVLKLIRENYLSMYFNPVGRYLKPGETPRRPDNVTIQTGRGYMRIFLDPYVHDAKYSSLPLEVYVRDHLDPGSFEFYRSTQYIWNGEGKRTVISLDGDPMLRIRYK